MEPKFKSGDVVIQVKGFPKTGSIIKIKDIYDDYYIVQLLTNKWDINAAGKITTAYVRFVDETFIKVEHKLVKLFYT
jgi:hypothetical protein